eukprot:EC825267.1.p1 GENE.EC825267.1~~EC825267.1.p1  ORF type:complete len:112 (+),score=56.21 EC825267.1:48-383(+)
MLKNLLKTNNIILPNFFSSIKFYCDSNDNMFQKIAQIVEKNEKVKPENLTIKSHFKKDLGLDSLEEIEILMEVENEFNFEIPEEEAEKIHTIEQVINYIKQKKNNCECEKC